MWTAFGFLAGVALTLGALSAIAVRRRPARRQPPQTDVAVDALRKIERVPKIAHAHKIAGAALRMIDR